MGLKEEIEAVRDENKSFTQRQLQFEGISRNGETGENDEDPSNMSMSKWYSSGRKRHFRRCNNEIKKGYVCPYSGCQKTYGSEGSLNLHMKIKHKAGSKTDREKYAREIILLVRSGTPLTNEHI